MEKEVPYTIKLSQLSKGLELPYSNTLPVESIRKMFALMTQQLENK